MTNLPPFRRPHVRRLVDLLAEGGHMRLMAITGPRQSGKTTLVLQALEEVGRQGVPRWYVAVDDLTPDQPPLQGNRDSLAPLAPGPRPGADWLVATWERARAAAERSGRGLVMVLDEIQRIPDWSIVVKGLWDRDRRTGCPLRVVILGSAPWGVLTGVRESLAGRFDAFPVAHWSLREMQSAFRVSLDEYVFFGGYPGTTVHIGDEWRWSAHVQESILAPVVRRDILSLTRVDKPLLMRDLLDLAAEYSGQVISYRKLQGRLDDAGNGTTVARYLDLLADAGVVAALQKHSAKVYLSKRSIPKLNVLNTAVMTAMMPCSLAEARRDGALWGRICESAVGAHLHNTLPHDHVMRLRYWRDRDHEVDFVLAAGRRLVALEVKSGRRRGRVAGLDAFAARFPGAKTLVVGTGGVPMDEFLSEPAAFWVEEAYREGGRSGSWLAAKNARQVREPAPSPQYMARLGRRRASVESIRGQLDWDDQQQLPHGWAPHRQNAFEAVQGPPGKLHDLARVYLGGFGAGGSDQARADLDWHLGSNADLLEAVIRGFRQVSERDDLPSMGNIVRLRGKGLMSLHGLPLLSGFAEDERAGVDVLDRLDNESLLRALGFYLFARLPAKSHLGPGSPDRKASAVINASTLAVAADCRPLWYRNALRTHPQAVAEALVAVHGVRVRTKSPPDQHLYDLAREDDYAEVARLAVPKMFTPFPSRCAGENQRDALRQVLLAAIKYMPRADLVELVRRRLARRGMDNPQRAIWLAARARIAPEEQLAGA